MVLASATVSAPGKVLLAGGYLILDREHSGTVLALDARFRTCVELVNFEEDAGSPTKALLIEVHSPQFRDVRRYAYDHGRLGQVPFGGKTPSPNKYVEVPLLYCLTLLKEMQGEAFLEAAIARAQGASTHTGGLVGLRVTLAADNGFYSQAGELNARGWPLSAESLRKLPPMLPPRTDEGGELAKTGLGSSATLVTSLLGALLHLFGAIELPSRSSHGGSKNLASSAALATLRGGAALHMLHALAQLCHCAAQGKVGSGFDVCSATFGSHVYKRFSPSVIAELLKLPAGDPPPPGALSGCVGARAGAITVGAGTTWDHEVAPFALPPGVEVVMADVSCGANTPSMVKKVQAWRKASSSAAELWNAYASASRTLQASLQTLCKLHAGYPSDGAWRNALARCGAADPATWADSAFGDVGVALATIRSGSIDLRKFLRAISAAADTPIEPPEQTDLLDATLNVRGVLMAVVPGAGGNDAVIALILPTNADGASGATATRSRVASMWRGWPKVAPPPAPSVVCELLVVESRESAAGHNGILVEGPETAAALATAREHGGAEAHSIPGRFQMLRVLTRSDLQSTGEAQARMQVLAAMAAIAVAAASALAISSMRARSP